MATDTLHDAIVKGLAKAGQHGLTKPSDLAFAIMTAIDAAGLKVIRTRGSNFAAAAACDDCGGAGIQDTDYPDVPCATCGGTGRMVRP